MAIDLEKIGSILRAAREEKGITLEAVSNALCLRRSLIQAIEQGAWDQLPHEVYVRSYVKEYANLLRITDLVLLELPQKLDSPPQETEVDVLPQKEREKRVWTFTLPVMPRRALVYFAVFGILAGFYLLDKMNRYTVPLPPAKIQTMAGVDSKNHDSRGTVPTSDHQGVAATGEGKKLMITCKERTWISVVIDDEEKKEFMLNAKEMIILQARDRFDLLIGNAGGVDLYLNGQNTEFSGKSGEVKRIRLS